MPERDQSPKRTSNEFDELFFRYSCTVEHQHVLFYFALILDCDMPILEALFQRCFLRLKPQGDRDNFWIRLQDRLVFQLKSCFKNAKLKLVFQACQIRIFSNRTDSISCTFRVCEHPVIDHNVWIIELHNDTLRVFLGDRCEHLTPHLFNTFIRELMFD